MAKSIVAALQIGPDPKGKAATVQNILSFEEQITKSGAKLVVMPEALLGGYPKGEGFGTRLGYRTQEGRNAFAEYFNNAIDLDGPELIELTGLSTCTSATLVLGIIERAGSSLFCTAIFIEPKQGVVAKHRKLMPTGSERLIWSQGDGSTMPVIESQAGKIGAAICWGNHMPLFRTAMYGKGLEIWCAPTVDEREIWQSTMRHIAHEGRCFVISACQVQPSPNSLGRTVENWDGERPLIAGGSVIIGPLGDILAGPLKNDTGLIFTEIDTADIVGARYDFDVVGHYSRPDVFKLSVNDRACSAVEYSATQ
ncbi:putative amidohydrolase [Meira miltonrushii]|uniref:Putative amidohydrolase n=1 Tax=Meira miltonrushii TaxID=1280837 RepID=A0A316V1H7_9BASI|nr:putative amidohydrolase [Meira miltonrushii]PWN31396.1 putative amidohydrolase [Meira miltonrushii]